MKERVREKNSSRCPANWKGRPFNTTLPEELHVEIQRGSKMPTDTTTKNLACLLICAATSEQDLLRQHQC